MSGLLLNNIASLYDPRDGERSGPLSILIEDGVISCIGSCAKIGNGVEVVDCSGLLAIPGFVDCHTHLLFAGSREQELYMRAAGRPYLEILESGGGIHNTVASVRAASEEELFGNGMRYLDQALTLGVTTVEIKSGYGLDFTNEEKMLKVCRRLDEAHPVDVVPTFLVHTVPKDRDRTDYLHEVEKRMIPAFRSLADWFDIFLEKGVFSLAESERLIEAAKREGYHIGFHTNQVNDLGGVGLAVRCGARHVNHLEVLTDEDADLIRRTDGLYPVFLPAAEGFVFSDHVGQFHKVRDLRERVVISSDFNPGSSPVLSPLFIITYTVLRYRADDPRLLINAYTANPAEMLYLSDRGRIAPGKKADLVLLDLAAVDQIPYLGTFDVIRYVIKNGSLADTGHQRKK
ncbi:imidazolonepropionase [bacterium]|nr:imidazolonepropionase [bacterium]